MKTTPLIALFLTLILLSCSGDNDSNNTNTTGVTGPKLDLIIDGFPAIASIDKAIINQNGIPVENTTHWTNQWFQGAALIDENTRVGVRLVDVVDHFTIGLFQHQEVITEGQPKVIYQLDFNDFQVQDFVEFTVGDNGVVTGFKIYRNYNGGSLDSVAPNVQVFTGTITQL